MGGSYDTGFEAKLGIGTYLNFFNNERPHQSLNYKTPYEIYSLNSQQPLSTNTGALDINTVIHLIHDQDQAMVG